MDPKYETAWTGPGESITGNEPWPFETEDELGPQLTLEELRAALDLGRQVQGIDQ